MKSSMTKKSLVGMIIHPARFHRAIKKSNFKQMKCLITLLGVVGMLAISSPGSAQSFTIQSGKWSSPSTWNDGIVPNASSGSIEILHAVSIPADTLLTVDELTVNHTLFIEAGATLVVAYDSTKTYDLDVRPTGILDVYGTLVCEDSVRLEGTSAINTFFREGSMYEHRFVGIAGKPPLATWDINATMALTGFVSSRSLNTTPWNQSYGNILYDCPNQSTSSFIELLGNIQDVRGNFVVKNTNGGVLRFTLDRQALNTINIGGDLVIEGNSEVWFSRAANTVINIGGDFKLFSTATASCYFTTTGTCEVNVAGNFIMNSTSPLRLASATALGVGTMKLQGDFTVEQGTITVRRPGTGLGYIELTGTEPQNFFNAGTITEAVTTDILNPNGVNFLPGTTITGDIVIRAGTTLSLPETDFNFTANMIAEPGGILNANQGTVILTGANYQAVDLANNTLHHVIINKPSAAVHFSSSVGLSGNLTVSSTNTTIQSDGNLVILSASDDGDEDAAIGSLPVGSTIEGDVTVQRFMAGEGRIYRYISSAVSNATVAQLQEDFPITGTFVDPSTGPGINAVNPSFFYYDETLAGDGGWIAYPTNGLASENLLVPGVGYAAFIRQAIASTRWSVTGLLNQGDINLPVTFTGTSVDDRWNLVGNPYAAAIDWDAAGWVKERIAPGIAIRDNALGDFRYWDGSIGNLESGRIAKGQALWVRATEPLPVLTVSEVVKTLDSQAFFRKSINEPDYIKITVSNEQHTDHTNLRLRDGATELIDDFDIPKFTNDGVNIAFEAAGISLAIAAFDKVDCEKSIPLKLYFPTRSDGTFIRSPVGNYRISASRYQVFKGATIFLYDSFTNQQIDISKNAYSFSITTDKDSQVSNRFSIQLSTHILPPVPTLLQANDVHCEHEEAYEVVLDNTFKGIRYEALLNGTVVASTLQQDDGEIRLEIARNLFHDTDNEVTIRYLNGCQVAIANQYTVRVEKNPIPEIGVEFFCGATTAMLHIENGLSGNTYSWFSGGVQIDQTTEPFVQVPISKDTTFFHVSVLSITGCESPRTEVRVIKSAVEEVNIREDNGVLYSNYAHENQWYLNSNILKGYTRNELEPTQSGQYAVQVRMANCIIEAFYDFVFQDENILVYPNPTHNQVTARVPKGERLVHVTLINLQGKEVVSSWMETPLKESVLNMELINAGMYTLKLTTDKSSYFIRVVKL